MDVHAKHYSQFEPAWPHAARKLVLNSSSTPDSGTSCYVSGWPFFDEGGKRWYDWNPLFGARCGETGNLRVLGQLNSKLWTTAEATDNFARAAEIYESIGLDAWAEIARSEAAALSK